MAALSAGDRTLGFQQYLAERNAVRDPLECNKPNIKAAFDATDAWIDANMASFNAALPLPARTALTTPQKALLLIACAQRRFLSGV